MASQVWLHIGTEKTGTTSIQAFLATNRAALAARGFVVPVVPGRLNHLSLAGYAQADDVIDDVRIMRGVRDVAAVQPFRETLEAELAAELAGSGDAQVVFSSEHCSSRLRSIAEIARLKSLCDLIAPRVKVVVYLRNQVDLLASWYSTAVKSGSTRPLRWPPSPAVAHMLDYRAMLDDWVAVFGQEALVVRRFVAADFVGGDLIADFAAALGLDPSGLQMPPRTNESLDLDCIAFLREFNRHAPRIEGGKVNSLRGPIAKVLEGLSSGPTFAVPARIATEVTHAHAAGNAVVAQSYFGGRHDPLFPPATAVAPAGAPEDPPIDPVAISRIAAALWLNRQARIQALEAELLERKAERKQASTAGRADGKPSASKGRAAR